MTRNNGTLKFLLAKNGPLMSLDAVAKVLGRSSDGLRFTKRGLSELATKLQAAEVHIGRRVRFRTTEIAVLVDSGASASPVDGVGVLQRKSLAGSTPKKQLQRERRKRGRSRVEE